MDSRPVSRGEKRGNLKRYDAAERKEGIMGDCTPPDATLDVSSRSVFLNVPDNQDDGG